MVDPFKEAFLDALKEAAHHIAEGLPSVQDAAQTVLSVGSGYSVEVAIPELRITVSGPVVLTMKPKVGS